MRDWNLWHSCIAFYLLLAIPRHAIALSIGFFPADVGSVLGGPIPPLSPKVVNPRLCVHPNYCVVGTMLFGFLL